MDMEKIAILKEIIPTQIISVSYFPNGKCYKIPMGAFFLDSLYNPFVPDGDDMPGYLYCEYTTQVGVMFMRFRFVNGVGEDLISPISIPLDKTKQTKLHHAVMSLVNMCAKRIITQEITRNKYAITSALHNLSINKEYS